MLPTLLKVSLVLGSIGPALMSETVLLIADPISLIDGSCICMKIATFAMRLVIQPVATVDISCISVDHSAETRGSVAIPLAYKNGTVGPNLCPLSISYWR